MAGETHRVQLGFATAHEEKVRTVPHQQAVGFAQGQQPRGIFGRDGVIRPLSVEEDRRVTGRHVGQELQEPDRDDLRLAQLAPFLQADIFAIDTHLRRTGEIDNVGGDHDATELDAEAEGVDVPFLQPGIVHAELAGTEAHLDGLGHLRQAFAAFFVRAGDEGFSVERGIEFREERARQAAGIVRLHPANARMTGHEPRAEVLQVMPQRRDDARTSNDRTARQPSLRGVGSHFYRLLS
jgi:hypothetical protein